MKNNFKYIAVVAALLVMLSGCSEEFLNRPPGDKLVDASFYQTDEQILAGTADLYSAVWKDYCDQANWKIGDVRAGVVFAPWSYRDNRDFTNFNVTGLSPSNVDAYRAFYQVIGQANTIILNINTYAGPEVSDEVKRHAIAEARFMRATAYAYLTMIYRDVPIIEDNTKYLNNADLRRNTSQSVWEFVRRDYEYAAENLMETAPQVGRLTRWAAEGMLARTYLNMAGLTGSLNTEYLNLAKQHAHNVIMNSGKQLLPNYASLFVWPYDNNNESLFELQWVYTTNDDLRYKHANTMVSQITPHSSIAANGDGWGDSWHATSWMLSLYDGLFVGYNGTATQAPGFTMDQRLRSTFFMPGMAYPEIGRHDDTYLEGDNHVRRNDPSDDTSDDPRDGNGSSKISIRKYVIGVIPGETAYQNYPNNTYMLRLAELYLIYAEAQVLLDGGTTSDGQALAYFNQVYQRARRAPGGGEPAPFSNPLTWQIVFQERVKEFAMEGMVWYDMVRRSYYNAQEVYDLINAQDRDLFQVVPEPWPNPTGWSFYKTTWVTPEKVPAGPENFYLPLPQVELSQAPGLASEPTSYDFQD